MLAVAADWTVELGDRRASRAAKAQADRVVVEQRLGETLWAVREEVRAAALDVAIESRQVDIAVEAAIADSETQRAAFDALATRGRLSAALGLRPEALPTDLSLPDSRQLPVTLDAAALRDRAIFGRLDLARALAEYDATDELDRDRWIEGLTHGDAALVSAWFPAGTELGKRPWRLLVTPSPAPAPSTRSATAGLHRPTLGSPV